MWMAAVAITGNPTATNQTSTPWCDWLASRLRLTQRIQERKATCTGFWWFIGRAWSSNNANKTAKKLMCR